MKQVMHQEVLEFIYDTEEERNTHVEQMISEGWENSGRVKRMKPESSIWDSNDKDNYDWFADFWKYY